jgi:hypothetical protein
LRLVAGRQEGARGYPPKVTTSHVRPLSSPRRPAWPYVRDRGTSNAVRGYVHWYKKLAGAGSCALVPQMSNLTKKIAPPSFRAGLRRPRQSSRRAKMSPRSAPDAACRCGPRWWGGLDAIRPRCSASYRSDQESVLAYAGRGPPTLQTTAPSTSWSKCPPRPAGIGSPCLAHWHGSGWMSSSARSAGLERLRSFGCENAAGPALDVKAVTATASGAEPAEKPCGPTMAHKHDRRQARFAARPSIASLAAHG